jgi:hypothetical protein
MDYLEGSSLQELLDVGHSFGESEVAAMAMQVLSGLSAIHKSGVTHCDVKPANVMRCTDSDGQTVFKLVDLGVAVAGSASSSLATLQDQRGLRGTPGYICPEIIRNEQGSIGPQADVWSLGATIFVLLTGQLPFCLASVPRGQPSLVELLGIALNMDEEPADVWGLCPVPVSQPFAAILKKALWKRREGRYTSADEMKEALRAHMADSFHVPPHWAPGDVQWGQALFVALDNSNAEFAEVVGLFTITARDFTVLRVERVQNLGQWVLYQTKKRDMEARGGAGPNEMRLFHGTDEATVPKIANSAFNRSYCGKNATAYGRGVYFASGASYSASNTYSTPNAIGEKRMFLCRVLAGAYTIGTGDMRVAPPNSQGTFFDTTVDKLDNPSIFVIYHDAQAYPEYLITFTVGRP